MSIEGGDVVTSLVTVGAVYFASKLGIAAYYEQKQTDRLFETYLNNGVSLMAAHIDSYLGSHKKDWAATLMLLKSYRDFEEVMDTEAYLLSLSRYKESLPVMPQYRVSQLTGSQAFWQIHQSVSAFVSLSNSQMRNDIGATLRGIESGKLEPKAKDDLVKEAFNMTEDMSKESDVFYPVLSMLHELSVMLESEKELTPAVIEKFRDRPRVKELVEEAEKLLKERRKVISGKSQGV